MPSFDYDAVIVGSGFGGSVSAYRLSRELGRVLVLERGRAYAPGDFPRSPYDLHRSFWDPSEGFYGIYNVWSFRNFGALVSSGLGGGSLIYANVLLRKDADTFVEDEHESWPVTYEELEPHYEEAERMLGAQRYPFDEEPYNGTRKTQAMREAAEGLPRRLGAEGVEWGLPPLAVTFGNEGEPPRPGVPIANAPPSVHDRPHPRLTCLLTGECDMGCNYGSKNTLDLNYLGLAKRNGAEIRPSCEVRTFAPLEGGGYRVDFVDYTGLAAEGMKRKRVAEQTITTERLVLSAGTLGSTFLLLKCRESFPRIDGGALGRGFSGNGDLLTLLIKAQQSAGRGPRVLEASYGPVITSYVHVPYRPGRQRGHYLEDAGYPYLLSWVAELTSLPWWVRRWLRLRRRILVRKLLGRSADTDLGAELAGLIGNAVLSSSSMPMLGMGRDVPDGRLLLDDRGRLTTDWKIDASRRFFEELEATARAVAAELGGEFRDSRIRHVSKLMTVHPLGGLRMARRPADGVVDPWGRVFGYEGFVIADGSVMPGPVGPNPSLTIAALANRFADAMLERG